MRDYKSSNLGRAKKILHRAFVFMILLCAFPFSYGQSGLQKIVIIRHGEKPEKGDNLSCAGLERSLLLSSVLYKKIGLPNQVYVPAIHLGKNTSVARMYQTIIPFAVKYNLNINSKYEEKDYAKIAAEIKQRNGTTLLVWEHNAIIKIVRAMGINENLFWDDNDFDSIWIITFANGISKLTKDKENINPSGNCQ